MSKHLIVFLTVLMFLSGIIEAFCDDKNNPVIVVSVKTEGANAVHVLAVSEAFEYANSLEERKLFLQAVPFYQGIIEVQPGNYNAHARLGHAFWVSSEYDKAQKEFEWILSRSPNDFDANLNMGFIYQYGKKDFLGALKYYEEAVRHSEGDKRVAALEFAGDIYQLTLYDWDKAIEYYRQILNIQSNNVKTHFNLAACLANKGRLDEAIVELKEVISTAPNSIHPELLEKAQQALTVVENARKSK